MKAYITTCCKEKSTILGEIPMLDRYISDRIDSVYKKSNIDNVAFFVLSGKFGLLAPSNKIPWYDKILEQEEVEEITSKVRHQLIVFGITEVELFANKEWANYVSAIEQACKSCSIKFTLNSAAY